MVFSSRLSIMNMLVINMKSILVALVCKQCMYKTHKKSETLIMPDFEPNLRDELIEGSFFKKKCPCCGNTIEFVHPVLYVDKEHKFILMIKPQCDYKDDDHSLFKDYVFSKKRYISKTDDVKEKIQVLETMLDDRVIEILKVKLLLRAKHRKQHVQAIRYHDVDKESKTIWFDILADDEHNLLAVTMQSYEQIKKTLPVENFESFKEIDMAWGIAYVMR